MLQWQLVLMLFLKVYNDTEDALTDGTVVYNSGSTGTITKVKPSIADNHIIANNTIGVVKKPYQVTDMALFHAGATLEGF